MIFPSISNLVYPLGRITTSGITLLGTAFLLNKSGHLATAAHVINNDENNLVIVIPKINSILDYQDTTDNQVTTVHAKIKGINPFTDLCILIIESDTMSNLNISGTDDLNTGEEVAVFGFPHADHGRMVLTQQNTEIGAKILLDSGGIKSKHMVLNIQARPGQSGSPVIKLNGLLLVGIILGSYAPGGGGGISLGGIDPHTLHQTTHAISSEYLKEMISNE